MGQYIGDIGIAFSVVLIILYMNWDNFFSQ